MGLVREYADETVRMLLMTVSSPKAKTNGAFFVPGSICLVFVCETYKLMWERHTQIIHTGGLPWRAVCHSRRDHNHHSESVIVQYCIHTDPINIYS